MSNSVLENQLMIIKIQVTTFQLSVNHFNYIRSLYIAPLMIYKFKKTFLFYFKKTFILFTFISKIIDFIGENILLNALIIIQGQIKQYFMEVINSISRKQLFGDTQIEQKSNNNLPKQKPRLSCLQLQYFLIMIANQQKAELNPINSLSQAFIALSFLYLVMLLSQLSFKSISSLKVASDSIKPKLQKFIIKNELSSNILNFYFKVVGQQQLTIRQLQPLFKKFFYQASFMIYSQKSELWKKLAHYALWQEDANHQQTSHLDFFKQKEIQIQKLSKFCQARIRKQQQEQALKLQSQYQLLAEQIVQLKRFQQKIISKTSNMSSGKSRMPMGVGKFGYNVNIKTMMVLEANFDIITLVNECETYQAPFLHFLVPFVYLLAQTLSYYQRKSVLSTSTYYLFQQLIKKINIVKCKRDFSSVSERQLMEHIVFFANYCKYTPQEHIDRMGQFLNRHGEKMKGFIPVFFDIFSFHAFEKYKFIEELQNVRDVKARRKKLVGRIQKLHDDCQKYKSQKV